jgi:hypothetical protein
LQSHAEHPFYGVHILSDREQHHIQKLLEKFRGREVNEELKKDIYNELQQNKYLEKLKIPFKVVLRLDPYGKFPNYVEVILDTKV